MTSRPQRTEVLKLPHIVLDVPFVSLHVEAVYNIHLPAESVDDEGEVGEEVVADHAFYADSFS